MRPKGQATVYYPTIIVLSPREGSVHMAATVPCTDPECKETEHTVSVEGYAEVAASLIQLAQSYVAAAKPEGSA